MRIEVTTYVGGNKKQLKVWLTKELVERVKILAAVEGTSLSKAIQRLLEAALVKH